MVPDRALVGRLVEHGAIEDLLRELLVGALQGFVKRLRPAVPGSDRAVGRLRSLKRVSEGMLGGLGAEIERQAEQKAKDFVDSILSSVVAQAADDLCDPAKAEDYGRFRAHLLDQLLDTPLEDLKREADKLDTDTVVDTVVEMAGAIAESDQLEGQISGMITVGLEAIGDQSAGQLRGRRHRRCMARRGRATDQPDRPRLHQNRAFPRVARWHPHRVVLSVC